MIEAVIVQLLAEQSRVATALLATPMSHGEYLNAQGFHAGIQVALTLIAKAQDDQDK